MRHRLLLPLDMMRGLRLLIRLLILEVGSKRRAEVLARSLVLVDHDLFLPQLLHESNAVLIPLIEVELGLAQLAMNRAAHLSGGVLNLFLVVI